jgi:hypothetical protein
MGFSPRKQNLNLYVTGPTSHTALLRRLGKHSLGKGCPYIKSLEEVDLPLSGNSYKQQAGVE